eukprot:CAMPEP_0206208436 /NCGR_PEP_ID=MMETSP0166-20121206/16263_1 /ASSEMBLY_ACC=CAM_ASM_000260 /TAXON_ID=95228 /ORGANISM="Vannella robusta, Strain DIVA3 518/3/11/1/6" /LENGTH=38 /DNA_ID= /DNA_START= /DNA_END= /DNA_ORIENTATION=
MSHNSNNGVDDCPVNIPPALGAKFRLIVQPKKRASDCP